MISREFKHRSTAKLTTTTNEEFQLKREEINIFRHDNDENNAELQLNGGRRSRQKHQIKCVICAVAKVIFVIDFLEKIDKICE